MAEAERSPHNPVIRRVCGAFQLGRRDVVDICRLGGLEISGSRADGWRRGAGTYRKPDAGSHDPGNLERRDKPVGDDEFAAFWRGLALWLHDSSGRDAES